MKKILVLDEVGIFIYLFILKLLYLKGQLLDVRDPDSGRSTTCKIMKKMNDKAETETQT